MRRLWAALRRSLNAAGPSSGAVVYDLGDHTQLYSLRDRVMRPPASLEKLYTSVAALQKLGPQARFHTPILSAGHLGPGGVWHGNLYLRGDGDPTLGDGTFIRVWDQGNGTNAAGLVAQLAAAGIRRVTGSVIGDDSLFDSSPGGPSTGFAPDIPDFGGELSALSYDHGSTLAGLKPGAFAARALATMMRVNHIAATASRATSRAPRRARVIASVSSPALPAILRLMNVPSDDLFAEMLTKVLGARFGARGTIAGGAGVIADAIASYGLHPTILDGSGLDRDDRSSPREVAALLRQVWGSSIGRELENSLPLIGIEGTVRRIATGTPAQGRCIAKTGTLNNVTNLAGYCHSRGHRTLAFAFFIDGPSNLRAIGLLSQMVAATQRY